MAGQQSLRFVEDEGEKLPAPADLVLAGAMTDSYNGFPPATFRFPPRVDMAAAKRRS
jgi:hypothetical protein